MRLFHRAVATAVAGLAFSAAAVVGATPAAAAPGEGCAGSPDIPATYVCIVKLDPMAAAPSTSITYVPVTVPRLCYVAGCTEGSVVNVPVVGLTPREGIVAMVSYQGQYYPISVGTEQLLVLINSTVDLVVRTVGNLQGTVDGVVYDLNRAIDELPDRWELQQMVDDALYEALYPYQEFLAGAEESLKEFVREWVYTVRDIVNNLDPVYTVQQLLSFIDLENYILDYECTISPTICP